MRCSVTEGQRYTLIQQRRDRKIKREEERGSGGEQREKEVDPDWVYQFFLHWFETDLLCVCCPSHRQWDITLYSGFRGCDSNGMSITHCDWLCSAMRKCLNHDEPEPWREMYVFYILNSYHAIAQSGEQVAGSLWWEQRQLYNFIPMAGWNGDTGPTRLSVKPS